VYKETVVYKIDALKSAVPPTSSEVFDLKPTSDVIS
jgi:hypothetical protein